MKLGCVIREQSQTSNLVMNQTRWIRKQDGYVKQRTEIKVFQS